jgi:hypothetical protein
VGRTGQAHHTAPACPIRLDQAADRKAAPTPRKEAGQEVGPSCREEGREEDPSCREEDREVAPTSQAARLEAAHSHLGRAVDP